MTIQSMNVQVAVVGGGLAGLTAARLLSQRQLRVVLLEGRARLGGRVESKRLPGGTVIDLGAQWHGPEQHRVLALCEEFGLATHTTFTHGRTAFEFQGRFGRYRGAMPLSLPLAFLNAALAGSRLAQLGRDIDEQLIRYGAMPNESQSLGDWVRRQVWPKSARSLVGFMLECLFCCNIDDVSLHLAAACVHRCGSLEHMLAIRGGAQELQFSAGGEQLVQRLADHVPHIRLESPVERIVHSEDGATLWGPGFEVHAERVVLATPPQLLGRIDFQPGLSATRSSLLAQTRMGSVCKSVIVYESTFWRRMGLSGETWTSSGPINGTYDTSNPAFETGVLTALSSGTSATQLTAMLPEQRKHAVLTAIAKHLGPAALTPLHYVERLWNDEPFTGGGYSVHVAAGAYAGFELLRKPEGALHWAGTETARCWPGYMEGALESGERVADEIASRTQ